MSGEFSVALSFEDYFAANRLMLRERRFRSILISLAAVIVGLGYTFISDPFYLTAVGIGIIALLVLLLGAAVLFGNWWVWERQLARQARKLFSQLGIEGLATVYRWNSEGVHVANTLGTSDLAWSRFMGWRENDATYLLKRTPGMFFAIPKSQITQADLAAFRASVIAAGIPGR